MAANVSPGHSESIAEFLKMAARLDGGEIEEADLAAAVSLLPDLTQARLAELADQSQLYAPSNPRLGWAIAKVVDVTAVAQQVELSLQARAAWYLGRAANNYVRPQRAFAALRRAEAAFAILEEETWIAACHWQQHVLAWAKPNLNQSATEVEAALAAFSKPNSPLAAFSNDCRLTLAYIQTLIGDYPQALNLLATCEKVFHAEQNQIGIINCRLIRVNIFRRQSSSEALPELESCMALAKSIAAPVYEALGLNALSGILMKYDLDSASLSNAETAFLDAISLLEGLDLPFWIAICRAGLSNIYIGQGRLSKAGKMLTFCRQIYQEYEVDAPLVDALINSGWLETYRANYAQGLTYLNRAVSLSRGIGNDYLMGISLMHLGEIYLEMGRYQQALQYLEEAIDTFRKLKAPGRMAETGLRLARCWAFLGRPTESLATLNGVEENATTARQRDVIPYLHLRRAESLFLDKDLPDVIISLKKSISAAEELDDEPGAALAQRVLAESYFEVGQLEEGAKQLAAAEKVFDDIGLTIELAACKIAWGDYYRQSGDVDSARKVWQQAANMGQNLAPDIIWQAEAGLASLAEDAGDDLVALEHYRRVIGALVRLRQDMWQPALAGFILKRPIDILNRALRVAVRVDSPEDILNAMEAGKAQVVANLFKRQHSLESNGQSPELVNLAADIRWRQEKARASRSSGGWRPTDDLRKLRLEIQEMVKAYDLLRGRIERQGGMAATEIRPTSSEFDLERFRTAANDKFGANWLALDYYLTGKNLTCIIISKDGCEYQDVLYSNRARWLLEELDQGHALGHWSNSELQILGHWLLPETIVERIEPKTTLLIAPHGQLHRLPWSALTAVDQPLVMKAVPVVVPSMQSLMVLMGRADRELALEKGLLVAVSDFKGRYDPLPYTVKEVQSLGRFFPASKFLINEAATWDDLSASVGGANGSSYSFFHFASHAFAEKISGRLNGLALYDRDLWLDELWDLAPLPTLVTLSACSGSESQLYQGDEQVGLATTCLAAGAQHVVASLWPIHDKTAPDLMIQFYSHLMLGAGVALALAKAQRTAVQTGKGIAHWAGFRCTGMPG